MVKTLVTHINPHLDDIAAIWLFKKFNPEFKDAKLEFISADAGNQGFPEEKDKVYLGVGRGRFDEHKGDLEDCATSLVWKYLKKERFVPQDEIMLLALEELVDWVRLGDLGRLPKQEFDEFSMPVFIRAIGGNQTKKSIENTLLGEKILERILQVLLNKHRSEKDWQGRIELKTKWGKGYAIMSKYVNRGFCTGKDGVVYLMYDPKYERSSSSSKSVQFFTPSRDIDLEPIYKKVKALDPQASWFLHQSHHMVICGSASAPNSKTTKLSFKELIEVVKSV